MILVPYFTRITQGEDSLKTFNQVSEIVILFFTAFGLLGFRYAMLSMTKKEKWTYIKIVGVIGNLLFFVIIILLFAANINDVVKSWGGL